jgi:hypothetical protein
MRASILVRMLAGGIGMVLSDPGISSMSTFSGRSAAAANGTVAAQHRMLSSAATAKRFEPPNLDKTTNA